MWIIFRKEIAKNSLSIIISTVIDPFISCLYFLVCQNPVIHVSTSTLLCCLIDYFLFFSFPDFLGKNVRYFEIEWDIDLIYFTIKMSDNRSAKKSIVSRRITHIRRFMSFDDVEKVKTKFNELKSAFADFEFIHEEFHSSLNQDDLIEESNEYFESFLRTYTAAIQEFRNFIRSSENTNTSNNSISSFHTRIPVLPQPEIFSGSPIDYPL